MNRSVSAPFTISLTAGFIVLMLPALFFEGISLTGWGAGYLLGLATVVLHLITSLISKRAGGNKFVGFYYFGLFIRFLFVCFILIFLLVTTKIDEFSFTVSFIISYIFHSVNEVIFLNQELSN